MFLDAEDSAMLLFQLVTQEQQKKMAIQTRVDLTPREEQVCELYSSAACVMLVIVRSHP